MSNYYGLIYKGTNLINNKIYIGKTTFTIARRKKEHYKEAFGARQSQRYFHRALRKYGKSSFKWELLGYCDSEEQLNKTEIICIEFYESNNSVYGYNMTRGGEGLANPSEETRQKLAKFRRTQTGWKHTEETKRKIGEAQLGEKNHRYGKKRTKEEIEKQIKTVRKNGSLKGEKHWMYGKGYLISGEKHPMYGKKHTEEARKKITKKLNEYYITHDSPNKGREFSEEVKQKISKLTTGGNNPRARKVMVDSVVYDCIKDAANTLGFPASTLRGKLSRYQKKGKFPDGWGFID